MRPYVRYPRPFYVYPGAVLPGVLAPVGLIGATGLYLGGYCGNINVVPAPGGVLYVGGVPVLLGSTEVLVFLNGQPYLYDLRNGPLYVNGVPVVSNLAPPYSVYISTSLCP